MISFGSVFLELVFGHLRELPKPGEEVFTDEFAISLGGAVTSATAAAAAGVRAGLCTVLGDDLGTEALTEHCAAAGVDLSGSVAVSRPAVGITVVLNFDGDRGFVTHIPPAAAGEQRAIDRWRGVLDDQRPAWCYLHAGPGVPDFLRHARRLGCKVMLDTSLGDERARDTVVECVALADIFVPNADELLRLADTQTTGAAAADTASSGATAIAAAAAAAAAAWGTQLVVKRGAAGALVVDTDGAVTEVADGVRAVTVRDLTGAGDNFAGAMIAALLGGASLPQAAVAANAAGSRAVGQLGAVGDLPAGTGGGWPLRPMIVREAAAALAAPRQRGVMEQGR
jgi:sugar/nucleoside kinase (ribokinase family)